MIGVFSIVIVLFSFLHVATHQREENLWCYECNTDLRQGRRGDCNDPYTPSSFGLVTCPRNESYHCHKSIVLYKNILVTVRACVLSREINEYCDYEDIFPHSSIECYFCKENGCNSEESVSPMPKWYLQLLATSLFWILA